jgi:hypothetical protein
LQSGGHSSQQPGTQLGSQQQQQQSSLTAPGLTRAFEAQPAANSEPMVASTVNNIERRYMMILLTS